MTAGDSWKADEGSGSHQAEEFYIGDSGSEAEAEEPEEVRRIQAGRNPTERQKQEHNDQNHAVYREWCPICVAAKAVGTPHRRKKVKEQREK